MKTFEQIVSKEDIPYQTAYRAHYWTSFHPEERAKSHIESYYNAQKSAFEKIVTKAEPDNKERALKEFERFAAGYKKRYLDYLSHRSGLASAAVTGPARFPTAKMESRYRVSHDKLTALLEYYNNGIRKIQYKLLPDIEKAIKSGKSNTLDLLNEKLNTLVKRHENAKAANKLLRSKKLSKEEKEVELKKMGFTDKDIVLLYKPDYLGRIGTPKFSLTNTNAEIKRLKGRIIEEEKRRAAAAQGNKEETFEGGKIVFNNDINRVQILFDEKPNKETIQGLKKNGFKWAPSKSAWQRFLSSFSKYHHNSLKEILGELTPVKKAAKVDPGEEKINIEEKVKEFEDKFKEPELIDTSFTTHVTPKGWLLVSKKELTAPLFKKLNSIAKKYDGKNSLAKENGIDSGYLFPSIEKATSFELESTGNTGNEVQIPKDFTAKSRGKLKFKPKSRGKLKLTKQEKLEESQKALLIRTTNANLSKWYRIAKEDYGVIGSGKAKIEDGKFIIDFVENNKHHQWSMDYHPSYFDNGLDYFYNVWMEEAGRETKKPQLELDFEQLATKEPEEIAKKKATEGVKRLSKEDTKKVLKLMQQKAKDNPEDISAVQVIKVGRTLNEMRGYWGIIDETSTNKKRLAPTYKNLVQWSKAPDKYDLIGVDSADKVNVTVKAKQKESIEAMKGFKKWWNDPNW